MKRNKQKKKKGKNEKAKTTKQEKTPAYCRSEKVLISNDTQGTQKKTKSIN